MKLRNSLAAAALIGLALSGCADSADGQLSNEASCAEAVSLTKDAAAKHKTAEDVVRSAQIITGLGFDLEQLAERTTGDFADRERDYAANLKKTGETMSKTKPDSPLAEKRLKDAQNIFDYTESGLRSRCLDAP